MTGYVPTTPTKRVRSTWPPPRATRGSTCICPGSQVPTRTGRVHTRDVQRPDRGPPFPSPQLDQEPPVNDSPMAARVQHGNCVVWGINCHFGAASPACRSVEHCVVRPCQESSGIFLEILSHLSAPRTLFAHVACAALCVCVVFVCRVGPSQQIASLSHFRPTSYVIYIQRPHLLPPSSPSPSDCLSSDGSYAPTVKPARESHFWNPSGIDVTCVCLTQTATAISLLGFGPRLWPPLL